MITPISSIPQTMPVLPMQQPAPSNDNRQSNITINQSNVAMINGNVGSLTLANIADIQNVPDNANVTINQSNTVIMMASKAYSSVVDMMTAWLKELEASLITGQVPDANLIPAYDPNAPQKVDVTA